MTKRYKSRINRQYTNLELSIYFRLHDPRDVSAILLGFRYPDLRDRSDSTPHTCQCTGHQTTGMLLIFITLHQTYQSNVICICTRRFFPIF